MSMHTSSYRKRNWPTDPEDDYSFNYTQHHSDFNQCSTIIHDNNNNNHNIEHLTISQQSPSTIQHQPPIKRVANERERTRTASVNDAFLMLRSLIPTEPINRKLSKIETLRLASSYISHLHAILVTGSGPADQPCFKQHQQFNSDDNDDDCSENVDDKHHIGFNHPHPHQHPHPHHHHKRYRPVCTFCVTEMKHHQRRTMMNKDAIIISNGQ
ncbi:unnamed protein product [Schistosoma turkestanicum]|nr:unnamed protein product [Schistosoma turkestanicum]